MAVRPSFVQGQLYESNFGLLEKQIQDAFLLQYGPGSLPLKKRTKKVFGILSPHSSYQLSGSCQAWAYKELGEAPFAELYVILGTNHSSLGNLFTTNLREDFETPFGIVKVDSDAGLHLIKNVSVLKSDELFDRYEHSVEVQLPFLQYINKDNLGRIKILPITITSSNYDHCIHLAQGIAQLNKKIIVIASSDLTSGVNISRYNHKQLIIHDEAVLGFITALDSKGLHEYALKNKLTICGLGALITAIEACKLLGSKKAKLLSYYNSSDITQSYTTATGYGGVVFA